MSSRAGPAIYIAGVFLVLLVGAVAAHVGLLWLAFPGAYLVAIGITSLMSGIWPSQNFRTDRRSWREALQIALIALFLNELFFGPSGTWFSELIASRWLPAGYIDQVRALPVWVAFSVALLLYEGLGYLLHRIAHAWSPLWERVHSVHHEAEHFGVALSLRLSHAEFLLHQITRLTLMQLTQIDPAVLVTVIGLATYGIFVSHANTSLRFGRLSRYLNTPDFHVWHHDPSLRVNYSIGLLSIFDRIAGTYCGRQALPERLGIEGITRRRSVLETVFLRPLHHAQLAQGAVRERRV